MLKGINKLLTGELLHILCDMGHGDELVIADANFPAHQLGSRVIGMPGLDGVEVAEAVLSVFPLDTYSDPALIMDLTDGDKAKGMATPAIWSIYSELVKKNGGSELQKLERYEFYERAKEAYAIIQTGEERQYGNLILVKGVVLPQSSSSGITRGAEYYRNLAEKTGEAKTTCSDDAPPW